MEVTRKKKRFQQLVASVSLLLKKAERKNASCRPAPGHVLILLGRKAVKLWTGVSPFQLQANYFLKVCPTEMIPSSLFAVVLRQELQLASRGHDDLC